MKTLLLAIAVCMTGQATTIVSQDGGGLISSQFLVSTDEALTTSWTSSNAYNNIAIFVTLSQGINTNTDLILDGTAYLTTSLGPGTTNAAEVASATFSFPHTTTDVKIFSGLTLSPGTYYLTLFSTSAVGGGWDATYAPAVITVDAGTTQGGTYFSNSVTGGPNESYAPGGAFAVLPNSDQLLYRVEGGLATPEPATLLLTGLGAFLGWRKRKQK